MSTPIPLRDETKETCRDIEAFLRGKKPPKPVPVPPPPKDTPPRPWRPH